mgnify:CR=1 FL=1
MRFDIISDTHGYLSERLLDELQGADTIVHAGDICSASGYRTLRQIAPVQLCLGNNDWSYDFGPEVKRLKIFFSSGLRWEVCASGSILSSVTLPYVAIRTARLSRRTGLPACL